MSVYSLHRTLSKDVSDTRRYEGIKISSVMCIIALVDAPLS